MQNAFTIDVEDWYQSMDFDIEVKKWGKYEDRIERNIDVLLEILSSNNVKATFFVLGYIAKFHPEMVRKIQKEGHEIGSHGYSHRLVYKQTKSLFREDIKKAKQIVEDITGNEVNLFRASCWSISKKTLWALNILEEEGFICDSSIQPFKTKLSGISGAPNFPYHPIVEGKKLDILEYPPMALNFCGIMMPFAGGLYLRCSPKSLLKFSLNRINRKIPGVIYTHPWELDLDQPRLSVLPITKFMHYYKINTTRGKIEYLLKEFDFTTLGSIIKGKDYPYSKI
ncbi:MAG: XrtA system polysaccharide deacetylase [Clostridia bacterium]